MARPKKAARLAVEFARPLYLVAPLAEQPTSKLAVILTGNRSAPHGEVVVGVDTLVESGDTVLGFRDGPDPVIGFNKTASFLLLDRALLTATVPESLAELDTEIEQRIYSHRRKLFKANEEGGEGEMMPGTPMKMVMVSPSEAFGKTAAAANTNTPDPGQYL